MRQIRTDLAMEAHKLWQESAETTTELPGVRALTRQHRGLDVTTVQILDHAGEQALGKPAGTYITLELEPQRLRESAYPQRAAQALAGPLRRLLHLRPGQSVLVVGLGNAAVTPDAVGPRVLEYLLVTRHLQLDALRPVSALSPGVLGATGLESAEIVRGVVERVRPARVVVADALVSRDPNRMCSTVQLADTGIVPGSGVGNHRQALDREALGVPVIAVGAPTVVEASTLVMDLLGREDDAGLPGAGLFVTPRDVDQKAADLARAIGYGISLALNPQLTVEELELLLA